MDKETFGRWTVVSSVTTGRRAKDLCRCLCGREKVVLRQNLKNGSSTSCGCFGVEQRNKVNTTHGHTKSVKSLTYSSWQAMWMRCENSSHVSYENYGGRGIRVCERWKEFPHFLEDMGDRPSKEYSIERNDTDGMYCLENCRWATSEEQNSNTNRNVLLSARGKTQTLMRWSKEIGISFRTLQARKRYGWADERIVNTPVLVQR